MNFHNVEKTNQSYESMTVVQGGSNIGVNFNIESAFEAYEHTGDYVGVLAESTSASMNSIEDMLVIDVSTLTDYEMMKNKLCVDVISA